MTVHVDKSLRLPESEYFAAPQKKSGIALHHTVCSSAHTTLDIWLHDHTPGGGPSHVATAFVVEKDGTIYEAFDPACWAWQFGVHWGDAKRIPFEKRMIGIEISSEGGLMEHEGKLYAFDRVAPVFEKPADEAIDFGALYRGYRWFDRYEPAQLTAVAQLVDDLCARFSIPRVYPKEPYVYYGDTLASFEGVIGHAMVRADKSDPAPDPRLWNVLEEIAGLRPVAVTPSADAIRRPAPLTRYQVEELFDRNATRVAFMDSAAGSAVLELLMELERRRVYLELETPLPHARDVAYKVVAGDAGTVTPLAKALGIARPRDGRLEVRGA